MRAINKSRLLVEKLDKKNKAKNPWYCWFLDLLLKVSFIKNAGVKNALDIRVENLEIFFDNLPKEFDDVRILFITDLHFDGAKPLVDKLLGIIEDINCDYCILGGDYTYGRNADSSEIHLQIRQIAKLLRSKSRVFGILGNYDLYSTAELLERYGVEMLINEGIAIRREEGEIYLAGMDDPSHYKSDDITLTDENSWDSSFKIMVCHSPARYKEAAASGYSLYLTGDTHGGQICLPGGFVIFCGPTAPRKVARGKWSYDGMTGYTSRGIGTSRIKARFYCPPEISIITLKKGHQ